MFTNTESYLDYTANLPQTVYYTLRMNISNHRFCLSLNHESGGYQNESRMAFLCDKSQWQ